MRGFFFGRVDLGEQRLHRAHHEGQRHEQQRDDDAGGREDHLEAPGLEALARHRGGAVQDGQHDAGNERGDGQREVHQGREQRATRQGVAHQHPSRGGAEEGVEHAHQHGGPQGEPQRRFRDGRRDVLPEGVEAVGERDVHDHHQRDGHQRDGVGRDAEAQRALTATRMERVAGGAHRFSCCPRASAWS
jgi:hypothetical protein